jgi:hypothetical protein
MGVWGSLRGKEGKITVKYKQINVNYEKICNSKTNVKRNRKKIE